MMLDEYYRIPELSLTGAYVKIRDYLQQSIDRYQVDANIPQVAANIPNETIAAVKNLRPVEKVTVSEMLNVMREVLYGRLEWFYRKSDGQYKMAEYARGALKNEAFDFPFDIQFDAVKDKLQSLVERAAELGDVNSQYLIARQLERDDEKDEAMSWYEKAAKQGDRRSIFSLANHYEDIDYKKSIYWYKKADEQYDGNCYDDSDAPYSIAELIIRNDDSPNRFAEAARWYEKAFDLRCGGVAIKLAGIYSEGGWGVKQDYAKCAEWTLLAAEEGDHEAMKEIGNIYEKGLGVEKNPKAAEEWRKVLANYEAEFGE